MTVATAFRAVAEVMEGDARRAPLMSAHQLGVPLARLYRSCSDPKLRAQWLPVDLTVRTATPQKYMRMGWPDGTTVVLGFVRTGPAKSQVAVQHSKLRDRAAVMKMKAFWQERLNALGDVL